jgi:hypothetical protein
MGQALLYLKRPAEALAAAEKAWRIAPKDDRVQCLYCRALFAVAQYQRSLAELPVDVVAHAIFHELLELAEHGHDKRETGNALLRFRSAFAGSPGSEALAGGLIEFTSHAHRHAEAHEAPQMRRWLGAISELFSHDPRFEILIKVFDVMVRYKESGDEKILLELPLEQRRLLEPAGADAEKAPAPKASR